MNPTIQTSFRLVIYSADGFSIVDIIWYHDGKLLKQTSNVRIKIKDDKTVVTIKKAVEDDAGTYVCKATNRIGIAETKAKLTVKSIAFAAVLFRTLSFFRFDQLCS